jgi:hypothetical protein
MGVGHWVDQAAGELDRAMVSTTLPDHEHDAQIHPQLLAEFLAEFLAAKRSERSKRAFCR